MNWFKTFMSRFIPAEVLTNKMEAESEEEMNPQVQKAIGRNRFWISELDVSFSVIYQALRETSLDFGSALFVSQVKNYQRIHNLKEDGILGPKTYQHMVDYTFDPYDRAVRTIMEPTIGKESGGRYWAQNRDGEFRGFFRNHRAEGKIHIGLSFGILQFTQDGGSLGKLLKAMAKKNPARFESIMGPTYGKLIEITNRPGPSGLSTNTLRGPRVKPVPIYNDDLALVEKDLWEEPWTKRFDRLGREPQFQKVQRELAEELYLEPMLDFLVEHELTSEKMVAVAFSGAIHRGVRGMKSLIGRHLKKEFLDEEAVLRDIAKNYPARFSSIVNDPHLLMDEWEGFFFLGADYEKTEGDKP